MTDIGLSFKELYEVSLKATYPIEIGQKLVEEGEIIAKFDKIQIANFSEIKNRAAANGGYDARSLIFWEETKELQLSFVQGVFSKSQYALMNNAALFQNHSKEELLIDKREWLESNESGEFELNKIPVGKVFIYNKLTGEKITQYTQNEKFFKIDQSFVDLIVDYQYNYLGETTTIQVGKPLVEGFLTLTGKMKVKDDITGQVKTGIIYIPKLKLMSDLSMRLGSDTIPQVGRLNAVALPVGGKGNKKVMEVIFLDDDIDSDM